MILTGKEIEREVNLMNLTITPFDERCLRPNSYIYHLSNKLIEIQEIGDIRVPYRTKQITIPNEGYILEPNKLYLGVTEEIIGSEKFVTTLVGRKKIGKLGMFLQITADLGQLGKAHKWTLEIHVIQPLKIYPFMEIGKVMFWVPKGDIELSEPEFYSTQNEPHTSKLFNQIQQ